MNSFKKYISILLIAALLVMQGGSAFAAEEAGGAQEAAPAEEASTAEEAAPAEEAIPVPEPTTETTTAETITETNDVTIETVTEPQTEDNQGGNVGNTLIETGDATTTGEINTMANTNLAGSGGDGGGGGSATVENSGNGEGSNNSGSATINSVDGITQTNGANVVSNLTGDSTTGTNISNDNVGNTTINTGDANTTGTILTGVNTNVSGIIVSEFNIIDDHIGDFILDFAAGCIMGCDLGSLLSSNTGNGTDSTNTAATNSDSSTTITQTNDATVEANLDLSANTGDNSTSRNTGGNNSITTGDANVVAGIMNFVNNNIAGNVIVGIVNIFGDLIGDIILPMGALSCSGCQSPDISAKNSGNGEGSDNNTNVNNTNTYSANQFNDANIDNNIVIDGITGSNETSGNTGGGSSIQTGGVTIEANVLNIANTNINGGSWWLVIVNEAGRWVGRIIGNPDGSFMGGSQGTEFVIDENGEITAINSGNGADSINNANTSSNTDTTINQTNTADIVNNVNLSANTGGNTASSNTGGGSSIQTGDAKIIANIVNFVNNNIIGDGRLVVTVINVFGSWMGDFVGPGQNQETNTAQGGTQNNNSDGQNTVTTSSGGSSNNSTGSVLAALVSTSGKAFVFIGGAGAPGVEETQVLAANNISPRITGDSPLKKKMTINLAWALLAFPLLFALPSGRRLLQRGNPFRKKDDYNDIDIPKII